MYNDDDIDKFNENEDDDSEYLRSTIHDDPIIQQIVELTDKPIIGSYDIEHLKKIHEHIFKYAESKQAKNEDEKFYNPGSFRPKCNGWAKDRSNECYLNSIVFYSRMDENDIADLNNTLSNIDVKALSALNEHDFSKEIANLYAKLDYIHPFKEGNSRTIREFTRTLALECEFNLDWEKITDDYDLYIARDLAVNEIAVTKLNSQKVSENAEKFLKNHGHEKNLTDLIERCLSKFTEQDHYTYKKIFSRARETDTRGPRD